MSANMRPLLRIVRLQSALSRSHQVQRTYATQGGPPNESSEQAMPLGPYYEAILASKPRINRDVKSEPVLETKPQPPREAKSEPAQEVDPQPPREAKPQPPLETKPQTVDETKPQPPREAKPQPVREAKSQPPREAKSQPVREAKSQPPREAKPQPPREAKSQPPLETKPQTVDEAKPQPPRKAKSQPVREAKSEEATASSSKPPRPSKKAKKAKRDSDKPKPSPPSSREGSPSPQSRTGTTTTSSSTSTVSPQPPAKPATTQEQTRIIFGSRLAGPAERADRLQSIRDRSTLIAGIRVPPRPEEPDNCCMSGCVNCVWDRYRDEMEEWATASALAKKAQQAQELEGESWSAIKDTSALSRSSNTAASMDDDGGGSETNWQAGETAKTDRSQIAKDLWDDGLYNNVPVGIREFMKHEKKLKEKHKKEGTFGG